MGWWGKGIMEGDSPSDASYCIEQAVIPSDLLQKLDDAYEDEERYLKLQEEVTALFKNPDTVTDIFNRLGEINTAGVEGEIMVQVFGVTIMGRGGVLNDVQRAAVRQGFLDDEWAQEDAERKAVVDAAIAQLDAYDNATPTEIESKGLLETIAEKMAQGHQGLINVTRD